MKRLTEGGLLTRVEVDAMGCWGRGGSVMYLMVVARCLRLRRREEDSEGGSKWGSVFLLDDFTR